VLVRLGTPCAVSVPHPHLSKRGLALWPLALCWPRGQKPVGLAGLAGWAGGSPLAWLWR